MSGFDPGDGWREVDRDTWRRMNPGKGLMLTEDAGDRYWVREAPAPLPTRPGYYVAKRPEYGSESVVVELLYSPRGQWVDAGDTRYLTEGDVRELLPLRRLVPLDDVIRYFRKEAGPDAAPDDWRLRAARTIEAEWETE